MQIPRILVLAGALFGLVPIALGIAALATPEWLTVGHNGTVTGTNATTCGLMTSINSTLCPNLSSLIPTVQGLEIAGVTAIAVGVILVVVLEMLTKNPWLRFLPQIVLFAGPTLIFIGLILFIKAVIDKHHEPNIAKYYMNLGYSIILMMIASLLGFLTAIYLAFIAGMGQDHQHHHHYHETETVVVQKTARF